MKNNFKKVVGVLAAGSVLLSAGCGGQKQADDGKIRISIGGTPTIRTEENAQTYDLFQENKARFEKENPNVEVVADAWGFDIKNYLPKAAGGELPTMYETAPTELKTIVTSGYARDISKFFEKYGYKDAFSEKYEQLYKYDGKYYGLIQPDSLYNMGIAYNISLFEKAGLLDENGIPKYPKTWDEFAETAKTIKDKTGKAGFAMATNNNKGGWHFLSLAYAFGTEFMKEEDGKWKATFASPEGIAALQYLKDLRWKYDVLQNELLADTNATGRMLATGEAAMIVTYGNTDSYVDKYQLDVNNLAMSSLPSGPAGKVSQASGNMYVFSNAATDEQVDACFKWLEMIGKGVSVNDGVKEQWEKTYSIKKEKKRAVGIRTSALWKDEKRVAAETEIMNKYRTVDSKFFDDYVNGDGVEYVFEPERCVQQLYAVLDAAIQEVLLNKDADCGTVLKKAQEDFQINYLDKEI